MQIIGDDLIPFEVKFVKKGFSSKVPAKVVIFGNRLPKADITGFDEEAWFSRWIIIKFHKQFPRNEEFKKRINDDIEGRSILLSFLLEPFRSLLEDERFEEEQSYEYIKSEWLKFADPVAAFIDEYVEEEEYAEVFKNDVYEKFNQFLTENRISYSGSYNKFVKDFNETLRKRGINFRESYKRNWEYCRERYGKYPKTWVGIKVKDVPTVDEVKEMCMQQMFIGKEGE